MPLFFDRAIEAIQQAAQDEGYSYENRWFPWDAGERDYTHLSDVLASRELNKIIKSQPGVLVFRQGLTARDEEGLVVFVVGEQPTRGIDDTCHRGQGAPARGALQVGQSPE